MGAWRYADARGIWQGEEAIELAVAADGKRNLFHDEVLLQLEDHQRPVSCPPLIAERRLCLKVMPGTWPYLVDESPREWISEPIPLLAVQPRWVWKQRVNETAVRVVARRFFERVHDELHASLATESRSPALDDDVSMQACAVQAGGQHVPRRRRLALLLRPRSVIPAFMSGDRELA